MRNRSAMLVGLVAACLLGSCAMPSYISKEDPAAGWNGGFEIVEDGYPVNWSFSQRPVEQGDMVVSLDGSMAHEGEQSLRVEVRSAASSREVFDRVWTKPSFSARTAIQPGKEYHLSFWLRNEGAKVHARWVATSDDYQEHYRYRDILESALDTAEWVLVQDELRAEEGEELLELIFVVTTPGLFWLDDVQVRDVP